MLEPLKTVLGSWEQRCTTQPYRQFQVITQHWAAIVGTQVAAHTRPISLQGQVLRVATTNSTWSQHLMFERQRIVAKINTQLSLTLTDIRFQPGFQLSSPGSGDRTEADRASEALRSHPSWVESSPPNRRSATPAADPQEAFNRWSEQVRNRVRSLTHCPSCQCPTPPGEIERWAMCAFCITKQWKLEVH